MTNYDEAGITQVVEFCYGSASDELLPEPTPAEAACDITTVLKLEEEIWRWVYQSECIDLDGFECRAAVACWVFYPPLRELSQTKLAARFAKKKQSINRAYCSFKAEFPSVVKYIQHSK